MGDELERPKPGTPWMHRNGEIYTVLCITNTAHDTAAHPPDVVYMGRNGNLWSRPLSGWHDRMTEM